MDSTNEKELHALLRLLSVAGVGSQRIRNLIARFKSPTAAFQASHRELIEIEGIDKAIAHNIKTTGNEQFADEQMSLLNKHGAKMVTFWDPSYPPLLKKIFDPPAVLFVRGEFLETDYKPIGVVGTRSPSSYGRLMAEKFAGELARKGVTVVSGLARGIDTLAHRAVLAMGGRTLAVLGSGVDVIYPDENRKLADQIITKGTLISEFPMGTKPDAPHFPRRNRIISGMSVAVLVVEAGQSSGALITADCALDQGRDVYAIPGNINNPKSSGCNHLIQQGAKLIRTPEDIFEDLGGTFGMAGNAQALSDIPLAPHEEKVFLLLSHEPVHIDLIAQKSEMQTSQALAVLLSLELKNLVKQIAGKNFIRA